ncbi:hypothetical protein GCM10007860_23240 [Chitiniphilus shinanonensis]|uniref:Uncharacterized protein n=1 Tax=Chitiniphilus shinanonensis TaxID=553088 RepID=A0ABQ6BU55_9NEIS|nr:hypothetical protein [Chitiniphilus shinanonensis]GLS05174.1 hypothetical protein GCM10007860_23240 [Chitiniphilus shinanonensis]
MKTWQAIQGVCGLSKWLGKLMVAGMLLAGAGQASAVSLGTCTGTLTTTFSPAITTVPQDVTATVASVYAVCNSVLPLWVGSGTGVAVNHLKGSTCAQITTPTSTFGDKTIVYSDAAGSTISGTGATVARVDLGASYAVTRTSTVQSGEFAGANAVETAIVLKSDLASCSDLTPLAQTSGATTLEFVSVP